MNKTSDQGEPKKVCKFKVNFVKLVVHCVWHDLIVCRLFRWLNERT